MSFFKPRIDNTNSGQTIDKFTIITPKINKAVIFLKEKGKKIIYIFALHSLLTNIYKSSLITIALCVG